MEDDQSVAHFATTSASTPPPRATRERLKFRLSRVSNRNGAVMRAMSAPVAAKHLSGTPNTRHWPGTIAENSGRCSGRPQSEFLLTSISYGAWLHSCLI